MPAYSFQEQFVPLILNRSKRHTIRGKRRNRQKVGAPMYLFTKMRTKACRRLMDTVCVAVQDIQIEGVIDPRVREKLRIFIDDVELTPLEAQRLAYADGFREQGYAGALDLMARFWNGRLPFSGDLLHWNPELTPPQRGTVRNPGETTRVARDRRRRRRVAA